MEMGEPCIPTTSAAYVTDMTTPGGSAPSHTSQAGMEEDGIPRSIQLGNHMAPQTTGNGGITMPKHPRIPEATSKADPTVTLL